MKTQPLVSIIVPIYNVEKYLGECLDSICGQTYKNIEIICVDDGSLDESAAILQQYAAKDSRIIVINRPNGGLSAARNSGLAVANGVWVTGVDSDDYLAPHAIEQALAHADDEEIDIIQITTKVFKDACPEVSQPADYFNNFASSGKTPISAHVLETPPVNFWGKFWRKSLLDKAGTDFPEGLWYEDQYFWFTVAPHASHIYYLDNEPDCYCYRSREDSIMGETFRKSKKVIDHLLILSRICDYWSTHKYLRSKLGYNEDLASPLELNLAVKLYESTLYSAPSEIIDQVWAYFKEITFKHEMQVIQNESPELLSLYCHTHPHFASFYLKRERHILEQLDVITKKFRYSSVSARLALKFRYRLTQLKCLISRGNKKRKYKDKQKKLKAIIRTLS